MRAAAHAHDAADRTGQVVTQAVATDAATLDKAINAAHDVYKKEWKDTPANKRRDILMKVALFDRPSRPRLLLKPAALSGR